MAHKLVAPESGLRQGVAHVAGEAVDEVVLAAVGFVGDNDEASAGEAPAGEAPAGEAPAGEAPAGEAPAGEAPAGEAPASEVAPVRKSVEPQTAPATSQRTVSAQLTAGWIPALDNAILAYVVPTSVHVTSWTVKFGDGSSATLPQDPSDPFGLTTTHAYGPGAFDVVAIARVSGEAYGAFFAPDGTVFEQLVPFSIDISKAPMTTAPSGLAPYPARSA